MDILFDCLVSVIHDPLAESLCLVLSSFAPLPLHFKHILLLLKFNSLPLLLESKSLPADWASAVPVEEVIVSTICEYCSCLHSLKDHLL